MRKRLYYILGICYALILAYQGYLFMESRKLDMNFIINVGFLLIIGVLLLVSFRNFAKLNRAADSLDEAAEEMMHRYSSAQKNLASEYLDRNDVFTVPALNAAFAKYQRRMKTYTSPKGLYVKSCPIEDYIHEDLLNQIGETHFNSAIPGTFTGLGILGTFLGLTLGMSSFSGNDIYAISDNIAPLLQGMKVAFYTSIYGILFSLLFNFIYRSIMSEAYEKLEIFLAAFHEYAEPQVRSNYDTMTSILIYQSNMANYLEHIMELLSGKAEEQVRGVDEIVEQFVQQMKEIMGKDFERIGKSLEESASTQETYARNFQRLEESTRLLLESSKIMTENIRLSQEKQGRIEKRINNACDNINNELYTFHQMRDLYDK